MLQAILRNTWRQAARSGALPAALLTVTLLLWLAAYASYQNQQALNAQRLAYAQQVRSHWLQQPDRHPHRVSHYGYLAFREKSPLSFLDSGVDSFAGTAVFLEAHRQNPANFSEAGQSAALIRFGELTPALVLQIIVPLAVFFLGFATISGERENETWRMMLAQGAPHRTILMGKALGLTLIAMALLLPGLSAFALVPGLFDAALLPRALLLAAAYGSYIVICALAAVLVSATQQTSRASLTSLILIWVVACVFVPRALQAWGMAAAPAPSRSQFEAALEKAMQAEGDSHNPNDPHFAAFRARLLAQYKVARVEDLPFNYGAFVMKEAESISSSIYQKEYGQLMRTFQRQGSPLLWGALVNPFLAVRRVSMSLAGSDLSHFLRFQQQAEAFRYDMIQKLNDLHLHEIRMANDRGQKVSRDNWNNFPTFTYQPLTLKEILRQDGIAFLSLAAWMFLLGAALALRTAP